MINNLTNFIADSATQAARLGERYGMREQFDAIVKKAKEYADKQVEVVVCGEFKRGKSSVVNALLGEEVCVVDEGIATSAISTIRYGKERNVTRLYGNAENGDIKTEQVDTENLTKFSMGTADEIGNTVMLDITIPVERLKDGLVLVDTPGVGSLDPRHLLLTRRAMKSMEAAIFVVKADEPVTTTELDFLEQNILKLGTSCLILMNGCDGKDAQQLDSLIEQLRNDILKRNAGHCPPIVPVSALKWCLYNRTKNDVMRQVAKVDDVEPALAALVASIHQNRGEELRSTFLSLLDTLNKEIQQRQKLLAQDSSQALQAIANDIAQLTEMKNGVEPIFQSSLKQLQTSQTQVLSHLQNHSIRLMQEDLPSMIDKYSTQANGGDSIAEWISLEIKDIADQLDEEIDVDFNEIIKKADSLLRLKDLTVVGEKGGFDGNVIERVSQRNRGFLEKLANPGYMNSARGGMTALSIGGTVAAVASAASASLLVPIVGVAVMATGVASIVKGIKATSASQRANDIRQQLTPRTQIAFNKLKEYVSGRYSTFSDQINKAKCAYVNNLGQSLEQKKKAATELQLSSAQRQQHSQQLAADLASVKNLTGQARIFGTRTVTSTK